MFFQGMIYIDGLLAGEYGLTSPTTIEVRRRAWWLATRAFGMEASP